MEMPMESKIEMHVSQISSIFHKEGGRFLTFRDIAEKMKVAQWSEYGCLHPALERMVKRGQLDHDETYGYCNPGRKETLRRDMGKPRMSRAEFDKLDYAAQAAHCNNGGIVV